MSTDYRLKFSENDNSNRQVQFYFNGNVLNGYESEPIAAALLANGIKTIRTCEITSEPRGIFCGIGHCYECRAEVDGVRNVRTCLTPVSQGTRVSSASSWEIGENES